MLVIQTNLKIIFIQQASILAVLVMGVRPAGYIDLLPDCGCYRSMGQTDRRTPDRCIYTLHR